MCVQYGLIILTFCNVSEIRHKSIPELRNSLSKTDLQDTALGILIFSILLRSNTPSKKQSHIWPRQRAIGLSSSHPRSLPGLLPLVLGAPSSLPTVFCLASLALSKWEVRATDYSHGKMRMPPVFTGRQDVICILSRPATNFYIAI